MKHLKQYLIKSKLTIILAIILGFLCKFSMGYFSSAVSAYTEALIISYSKEVIDKGVSSGIIDLLDGKSILNEVYVSSLIYAILINASGNFAISKTEV